MKLTSLGVEQVIEAGGTLALVDCGDGASGRWREAGFPGVGPDLVLITDGAPERVSGLFGLLSVAQAHQRQAPLTLVCPLMDERAPLLIEAFVRAFGADFPIRVEPESAGAKLEVGGLRVQLRPAARGVGYRLEYAGERMEFRAGHEA
ncbi:MAG: hypothetical protein H6741_09285 [Alphaproteobacteria bacterium]|nr:hypothetical protein [Alphaproteobacteria bacterium]MCB9792907.1 hypothetical protein [Alphaproteobacteria bacterium]